MVAVTGRLLVDEEQNPMQFSQSFQLVPEGGSYFVYNVSQPYFHLTKTIALGYF
jgi:hypothetical protein